jgi:hypothetical protein
MNRFVAELGARHSLGYAHEPATAPVTIPVPYPGDDVHEAVKFGRLLRAVGAEPESYQLEFPVSEAAETKLAPLIGTGPGPFIAIHPGASIPARRWPRSGLPPPRGVFVRSTEDAS